MDKTAPRWSPRCIWQGAVACGRQQTAIQVYVGPGVAPNNKSDPWWQGLAIGGEQHLVISSNLPAVARLGPLPPGRLLVAGCVRQALPPLVRQLQLYGDRLAIGMAVTKNETPCWLATVEGLARRVTILTDKRSSPWPLAPSGLALRQLHYGVSRLDVDILIVSPELIPQVQGIALPRDVVIILTDGARPQHWLGDYGLWWDFSQLPVLPSELLAHPTDLLPLGEAVLLAAHLAHWPRPWQARLLAVEQALQQSEWPLRWQLASLMAE